MNISLNYLFNIIKNKKDKIEASVVETITNRVLPITTIKKQKIEIRVAQNLFRSPPFEDIFANANCKDSNSS